MLIQELARPPGKVLEQGFKPITGGRYTDRANQSGDHGGGGGGDHSRGDKSADDPDDHVKYETYLELKLWVSTFSAFWIFVLVKVSDCPVLIDFLGIFLLLNLRIKIFWLKI